VIIGTAGHIDHGKTALVRALTGVDTDRLPEEKRRGITIELGFAPLLLEDIGTVGVVDVPGHEGFVRTMVAGATGIDLALLVVASDEGVMPQTREHLSILSLLDVRTLVVALTKADLVDANWIDLVRDDVALLLAGTRYSGAPIIATSIRDGRGYDALKQALVAGLREGRDRPDDDLFRMPIDRAFTVKGTGTVVTGTVWSGRLAEGDSVRVFPAERLVRVRGIQSHGASVGTARPGQRAAVALVSVDLEDVPRGSQLVSQVPWHGTSLFHAHVVRAADAEPWRPREWLRLHVGTAEVGARVVARAGDEDDATASLARVVLDTPLLLRAGDRFVLRRAQPLSTVGGGTITDPTPLRRRSRPTITGALSPSERLGLIVEESGREGMVLSDLPVRLGLPPSTVSELLAKEVSMERVDDRVHLKRILEDVSEVVMNSVITHHASHPLSAGLSPGLAWTGIGLITCARRSYIASWR
jgi:selenocysteine-specific elongation factor